MDSPIDGGYYCSHCITKGVLGDVDSAALTEGGAWILTTSDELDEYHEDNEALGGRTRQEQHYEEQLYDEPDLLLGDDNDLAEWVSENQPNDDERKSLVLLSLPVDKVWAPSDLENEHHLRIGLLLLFNLIQGKNDLSISRSIHIQYTQLTKTARDYIMKRLETNKAMEKRQNKLAGKV